MEERMKKPMPMTLDQIQNLEQRYPLSREIVGYDMEKPQSCRKCDFWDRSMKACGREACFYAIYEDDELKKPYNFFDTDTSRTNSKGVCRSCPYGRDSRCIGFCISKLLPVRKKLAAEEQIKVSWA